MRKVRLIDKRLQYLLMNEIQAKRKVRPILLRWYAHRVRRAQRQQPEKEERDGGRSKAVRVHYCFGKVIAASLSCGV